MVKNENEQEYVKSMDATVKSVLKIIGYVILGFVFFLGIGLIVQFLWNWLMPDIFHLQHISYWQAMGILGLTRILFGGFGSGSASKSNKSKSEKSPKNEIAGTIDQAIHEEIQKELKKEYAEKNSSEKQEANCFYSAANDEDQEAMYEDWWANEGEKAFDDFVNKKYN